VAKVRDPYAAALWEIGSRINAIGAGPDSDEVTVSERRYVRALEDVMMMIKVLQITGCPVCGGVLEVAQGGAAGDWACTECGATSRGRHAQVSRKKHVA
jgi:ribosomal protein L37AE/L43A